MVIISFDEHFKRIFSKLDKSIKEKVIKQIEKLKENPEIGKPMRFIRKNTKEIYISSFRLSYFYIKEQSKIILLDLYHKDEQ